MNMSLRKWLDRSLERLSIWLHSNKCVLFGCCARPIILDNFVDFYRFLKSKGLLFFALLTSEFELCHDMIKVV